MKLREESEGGWDSRVEEEKEGRGGRGLTGDREREGRTTKYVNVVLTPPARALSDDVPMPQTVCCRSFGDYTNEVAQREKCTFHGTKPLAFSRVQN